MIPQPAAAEIVCLVDDEASVIAAVGRLLASDGFAVQAFNDPNSFLAHVETHPVALAILDIWMEQMTGLEVQAKLRRMSPQTRVIVMTGHQDSAVEQMALDAGAEAFFTKPFDDDRFLAAVHRALELGTRDLGSPKQ